MSNTNQQSRVTASARAIAAAFGPESALCYVTADTDLPNQESVLASVRTEALTNHVCGDCNTHMTTASYIEHPYCVNCRSVNLKATLQNAKVAASLKGDDQLGAVACDSCHMLSVVDNRVLSSTKGRIYCTACGTGMKLLAQEPAPVQAAAATTPQPAQASVPQPQAPQPKKEDTVTAAATPTPTQAAAPVIASTQVVKAESAESGIPDSPTDDRTGQTPTADEPKPMTLDQGSQPTTEPVMKTDEDAMPPVSTDKGGSQPVDEGEDRTRPESHSEQAFFDDVDTDLSDLDLEGDANSIGDAADQGWSEPMFNDVPGITPAGGDYIISQDGETVGDDMRIVPENDMALAASDDLSMEEDDPDFDFPEEAAVGDPMLDAMGLDDTVKCAFFVSAGKSLLAMKQQHVVARLTPQRAGRNADVMHTEGFQNAIIMHAQSQGLRKALASLGFKPVRVPVLTAHSAQARITAANELARDKLTKEREQFARCLSLAAAAIARGMLKSENPLQASIAAEFSKLGMSNAGRVAATLMRDSGIAYAKELTKHATALAALSPAGRKEIETVLGMVQEAVTADTHSDEMPNNEYPDMPDQASVVARLLEPGVRETSAPQSGGRQVAALLSRSTIERAQRIADDDAAAEAHAILTGQRTLASLYGNSDR